MEVKYKATCPICGKNLFKGAPGSILEGNCPNEEVTDRCGNKTAYEYHSAGRISKITSKNCYNNVLAHVSYGYDAFDNLTTISRGDSMQYQLGYDSFRNLQDIGIADKTEKLVSYTYKNSRGRLKEVTYANGDCMKTVYNTLGQTIAQKWYNKDTTLTAHYKYAYDEAGNIIQSVDILAKKAYTYTYENGKLLRVNEFSVTIGDSEMLTSRTLVTTIIYTYNANGTMAEKRIMPVNGAEIVYIYGIPENGSTQVVCKTNDIFYHSVSKKDRFGRKEFDELQFESGLISRRFSYHKGVITPEHKDGKKLKSMPITQLVSHIELSDGRTIDYEYDPEERITKIVDSVDGTTEYTYDAMGQLLTEKHNGAVVNTMFYDNYGNILAKNGVCYTYDSTWKDLLTGVCGDTITYDAQGNPLTYRGHTLTWEKGRQLKSFDNITYTYNANGIRTSKTIDGVRHEYLLDGAKILRETWNGNTLIPLYDNEDSVCGIVYNGASYYFLKNLQKDIVVIINANGETVTKYTYDAWGRCIIKQDISNCSIATINPYRYRGYYYDQEINMYYLQSRYYDPAIGRFINADAPDYVTITGGNLFAYCKNKPVCNFDFSGFCDITFFTGDTNLNDFMPEGSFVYTIEFPDVAKWIRSIGLFFESIWVATKYVFYSIFPDPHNMSTLNTAFYRNQHMIYYTKTWVNTNFPDNSEEIWNWYNKNWEFVVETINSSLQRNTTPTPPLSPKHPAVTSAPEEVGVLLVAATRMIYDAAHAGIF